jgi:pimeloyl-ACP methyl ester carboxylesterase
MKKLLSLRGKLVLLLCLVPGWLLAQGTSPTGLAGTWKGPLTVPGGALPIQITVLETTAGKLTAELLLPVKKTTRHAVMVTVRGDSVTFFAPTADCRFICRRSVDGSELRGKWLQTGFKEPLTLFRVTSAVGEVVEGVDTGVPLFVSTYRTDPVQLSSGPDKVALAGSLTIPDGDGPFPAVVLLSDLGAQDRDATEGDYRLFGGLANYLSRYGIAVLRLDDRGVGQSGGDNNAVTTTDRVRDAQAGLSYLRALPSINPARIGLIGHGEGGNVALLAATQPLAPNFVVGLAASGLMGQELLARQPEPVNAADTTAFGIARRAAHIDALAQAEKLRAAGSNAAQIETYLAQQQLKMRSEDRKRTEATLKFRRAMLEIVKQTPNNDQAQAIVVNMLRQRYPNEDPAVLRARAVEFTTPWNRAFVRFDPRPELAKVQCPVLLLQGTDDTEVEAEPNLAVLEKGLKANKRLTIRRLPGINHELQAPAAQLLASADGQKSEPIIAPVVLETVRDWVLQQAGK